MEKIQLFFDKVGLLTKEQFNELIKHVDVSVDLPNKDHKYIQINIKYSSAIPIDIFSRLYLNSKKHEHDLSIHYVNGIVNIELNEFVGYLKF
jgi:regulatory protein YycH of two-component signal transduction system YycFG